MAKVREQVALSEFTTLRLGGPAHRFVEAATDDEIIAEVRSADERGEPMLILGGGSNLVISDDGFPGTVIHVATKGIRRDDAGSANDSGRVAVTVAAGEDWDAVVASCVAERLAGLECLSGIPGLAGATPIQNVGAYGQEVAETITLVRAYDRERGDVVELPARDCGFGYRTSAFKRSARSVAALDGWGGFTGTFVVLNVVFGLNRSSLSRPVRYRELAHRLGLAEGERAPLGDVRAAVLGLRRGKGMVLDPGDPDTRSAGSFFTNPILDAGQYAAFAGRGRGALRPRCRHPALPCERRLREDLRGVAYRAGGLPEGLHGPGGHVRRRGPSRPAGGQDLGQAHAGPGQPGRGHRRQPARPGPGGPGRRAGRLRGRPRHRARGGR